MKFTSILILLSLSTTLLAADYAWTYTTTIETIQGDWDGEGLYIYTTNGKYVYLKHSDFDQNMLRFYHAALLMAQSEQIDITIQYRTDLYSSYSGNNYGHIKLIRTIQK